MTGYWQIWNHPWRVIIIPCWWKSKFYPTRCDFHRDFTMPKAAKQWEVHCISYGYGLLFLYHTCYFTHIRSSRIYTICPSLLYCTENGVQRHKTQMPSIRSICSIMTSSVWKDIYDRLVQHLLTRKYNPPYFGLLSSLVMKMSNDILNCHP